MGLAWFGNTNWNDERPPLGNAIDCTCSKCGNELYWQPPIGYTGNPPKSLCCNAKLIFDKSCK